MIDTPFYKEIMNDYPKELVHEWDFIQIGLGCRLHYKIIDPQDKELCGFYFHSVSWTGNEYGGDGEYLDAKNSTAETLLYGIALFDGIRHLYFGTKESENEGYFYYPDLDRLYKIMKELSKLEKEYCSMHDKREL